MAFHAVRFPEGDGESTGGFIPEGDSFPAFFAGYATRLIFAPRQIRSGDRTAGGSL